MSVAGDISPYSSFTSCLQLLVVFFHNKTNLRDHIKKPFQRTKSGEINDQKMLNTQDITAELPESSLYFF